MSRLVPLLTAADVAKLLLMRVKDVYALPIRKRRIGTRGVRYHPDDVAAYIDRPIVPPMRSSVRRSA